MQNAIETGVQIMKLLGIVAIIEFLMFFVLSPIKQMIKKAIINRKLKKLASELNELLTKELMEKSKEKEEKK